MAEVAVVGIVLAIPPLVDLTITHIKGVSAKIHTYKHATGLIKDDFELHSIHTSQLEISLGFVKDAAPSLSYELNSLLHKTLSRLNKSLDNAFVILERGLDPDGNVRRLWYSTLGRSSLRRELDEVERSQSLFQRAVQFTALFGGHCIAPLLTKDRLSGSVALTRVQRLTEAIQSRLNDTEYVRMLLDPDVIPAGRKERLPYCDIKLISSLDSGAPLALVEYRKQETSDTRKARDIARILYGTDPSMAILRCQGFLPVPGANRCELLYPIPDTCTGRPRTLRELLLASENDAGVRLSVNARIKLAQQLANAVLFVHTAKLVHKNIRPENIIILETTHGSDASQQEIGDLFLMGFDFARKEDETSARIGDNEWNKNIYRHPQRQGMHLEVDFNMLHDIYSLGVVMLEIALWRSFVLPSRDSNGQSIYVENRSVCRFFDRKSLALKTSYEIWKSLVRMAEKAVAPALGNRYRDTVLMCLNCLDGGFGDTSEFLDEDGVFVGLVYIERILTTLDDINV